jgi:hypothetical protein
VRRLTLWIISTVAAVVLLLSYRTSFGATGAPDRAPVLQAPTGPAPSEPGRAASAPSRQAVTI